MLMVIGVVMKMERSLTIGDQMLMHVLMQEQGVAFPVNYTPSWASWTGFAVSNRTETTIRQHEP